MKNQIHLNNFCINLSELESQCYMFEIKNRSNNETAGQICFAIRKDFRRYASLFDIRVEEKYQHQGLGTALIKSFEKFLVDKRITYIEGKFYPSNDYAKDFYFNNGYSIDREDGGQIVSKSLTLPTKQIERSL